MAIVLGDDGTLDTVIVCTKCGREFRFNFDPDMHNDDPDNHTCTDGSCDCYDKFVERCIEDVKSEHVGLFGRCVKEDE